MTTRYTQCPHTHQIPGHEGMRDGMCPDCQGTVRDGCCPSCGSSVFLTKGNYSALIDTKEPGFDVQEISPRRTVLCWDCYRSFPQSSEIFKKVQESIKFQEV